MANALTKSTQDLLSRLNKDKVPMENQQETAEEENAASAAEEAAAAQIEAESSANAKDVAQDDTESYQNSEDLAAYFKALGLIDSAKARAYAPNSDAAIADGQPELHPGNAHGGDSPPISTVADDIHTGVGADADVTGANQPDAEEWASASPTSAPEQGGAQESLLTPPKSFQPTPEEQVLDFSHEEAGNAPGDFGATLDFLDNLAEKEAGILHDDGGVSEDESIQPVELEVGVASEPEAFEPTLEEAAQSQPVHAGAASSESVSVEFDQDRSGNLRHSADILQCSVEDLVVTAVDWYLDAILNAEEADAG